VDEGVRLFDAQVFKGAVLTTQDYLIDVRSVGTTTAATTLRFTIPPR